MDELRDHYGTDYIREHGPRWVTLVARVSDIERTIGVIDSRTKRTEDNIIEIHGWLVEGDVAKNGTQTPGIIMRVQQLSRIGVRAEKALWILIGVFATTVVSGWAQWWLYTHH